MVLTLVFSLFAEDTDDSFVQSVSICAVLVYNLSSDSVSDTLEMNLVNTVVLVLHAQIVSAF